ncbi:MAG: metallophosphoesterase [Planctomycetaceae bacterium]|jgi:Icc-related predicted phosphoesterase|nr:metallophosphoesterase [Planctomycetaceae bacterium]
MQSEKTTRRQFLKTAAVTATLLAGDGILQNGNIRLNADETVSQTTTIPQNVLPRFAVISDTHFGGGNGGGVARNAHGLKNLLRQGNLDAIFVVGDLTNNGQAKQYDQLLSVYKNESVVPQSQRVVFMMGNHEWYNKEDPVKNYLDKLGQPKHQYIDLKGYPFITISMSGGGENDYNDEGQKFLDDKLADANQKYPNKPIFVFFHIPPKKTSYGSHSWGNTVLPKYLEKYPQVVVFNGHTHTPVGDQRMIFQDKYTAINDGSMFYCCVEKNELSNGITPEGNGDVQEGMIVNVQTGNNFNVERWDLRRNVAYQPWNVDWKNKNYKNQNNKTPPKFDSGIKPKVHVSGGGALVTYPQAKDDDAVFRYFIEINDGDKVIASYKQFSQFYLTIQQPDKLTAEFTDLPKGKQLTASVKALDVFNNESTTIVSENFTI